MTCGYADTAGARRFRPYTIAGLFMALAQSRTGASGFTERCLQNIPRWLCVAIWGSRRSDGRPQRSTRKARVVVGEPSDRRSLTDVT